MKRLMNLRFECVLCLFFKQKTAYEMRISDWSSDVCSSDLVARTIAEREAQRGIDHDLRARLASAWATTQIVKLHGLRNVARFTAGDNPGAEGDRKSVV